MLPLAVARACLSSLAPLPRPQTRAAPLSPLHRRRSTATLPRPARIPLLRPLGATMGVGASSRPARDRVIDFGKHKGQMLGTLPPSYLHWVVAELDYGDTLVLARLAREVLDDPVYVDRVEWEHAHRFLQVRLRLHDGDGPLQEMAERFGWDLSNEDGWGRLDFRLLSTSYGGRIPRKADRRQSTDSGNNRSPHGGGALFDTGAADPDGPRGKRDERRERMRTRREEQVRTVKLDVLGVNSGAKDGHGGTWFVGPTGQIYA
ncbi:hypothetical protein VPH35_046885 [Triticum aestivum]|uniref:uncharacterized protein n=1 Tax=Triticum aestivum TaxID=4565 RepID=UPI001D010677|nr:uncharacterized protein LOC123057113 [Triticum aestivum]